MTAAVHSCFRRFWQEKLSRFFFLSVSRFPPARSQRLSLTSDRFGCSSSLSWCSARSWPPIPHLRFPNRELETRQVCHSALCRSRKTARHFYFDFLCSCRNSRVVLLGAYAPGWVLFALLVLDVSVFYFVTSRYWVSKEVSGNDAYQREHHGFSWSRLLVEESHIPAVCVCVCVP